MWYGYGCRALKGYEFGGEPFQKADEMLLGLWRMQAVYDLRIKTIVLYEIEGQTIEEE